MTRLFVRFAPLALAVALVATSVAALPPPAQAPAEQATAAQDPQAGAPAEPQAPTITAIPATDIQAEAAAVNQTLARIEQMIGVDPLVARIEAQVAVTTTLIEDEFALLEAVNLDTVVMRTLDDLELRWIGYQGDITGAGETVTGRYTELQAEIGNLDGLQRLWRFTVDDLANQDLPADVAGSLSATVNEVLAEIDATRQRTQTRSDEVLAIQNAVSAIEARVNEALARIANLSSGFRQRVLARDARPIWALGSGDVDSLGGEARDVLSDRFGTANDFFSRNQNQSLAHFVAFLIFAAIALGLRWRASLWEGVEGTEDLRGMLRRPVSIAAIFALLSGSWFYTGMPTSLVDLFLLFTLIPVLRLAPSLIAPGDRGTLYGLLSSYAAVRVVGLLAEGSGLRRFALFALSVAALLGLTRFVRKSLPALIDGRSGWFQLTGFFLRLAVPLLTVAVVANLGGWVRLAWVITAGTISSAYAALILWLFATAASGIAALAPHTPLGALLPSLRRNAVSVSRVIRIVAQLTALWIWVDVTLLWFLVRAPLIVRIEDLANRAPNLGGLQIRVGDVFWALVILIAAPLISRLVRFFFMEELRPRLSLPRGSADGVASLFHYAILTIGVLLAATAAGFNTTQLTVVFGALGVGIGFGLQNVVSNFISGLILIFERPISVGDRITAGALREMGVVTRIGIRASTVRTFDGAEIVVPNSDLITKEVTNWTLTDMVRRLELRIGVRYGTDPQQVIDVLRSVAADHEEVLQDPEAIAVFDGFGESSLDFRLLYWVPMDGVLKVKTEVNLAMHEALKEAGIRVAFPRRDLRIRSAGGLAGGDDDEEDAGSIEDN